MREYIGLMLGGYTVSFALVLTGLWHVYRAGWTAAAELRWMGTPYTVEVLFGALAKCIRDAVGDPERQAAVGDAAVGGCRADRIHQLHSDEPCVQYVFSWGPWKLYGRLEYYQWLYVVGAMWALNLLLSTLWLRRFAFGPLEWMWRSLTYWKRQPMLLRA